VTAKRDWLIALTLGAVLLAFWLAAGRGREGRRLVETARVEGAPETAVEAVRVELDRFGDSLRVLTRWSAPGGAGTEVWVGPAGTRVRGRPRPPGSTADTAFVGVPAPGQSASGLSCVQSQGEEGERCIAWQFVRPTAQPRRTTSDGRPIRVVVRPDGMQVDPDPDRSCDAWREAHPDSSVWLAVNELAVPACMGPNGKPTVAQFCAFALLPDGRKVRTALSRAVPYCEAEFESWLAESAS
jgi:hypothetical protein